MVRMQESLLTIAITPSTKPNTNNQQGTAGFDALFAEADSRQNQQSANVSDTHNRDSRQDNRRNDMRTNEQRQDRTARNNRSERQRQETADASAAQQSIQNTPVEDYEAEQSIETEAPLDEAAAIANVAEILQLPTEIVTEMLEDLAITAQDLTEPQNVVKFLQVALEAETPAELLTDPDFPQLYKYVNESITELTETTKTTPVVSVQARQIDVTIQAEDFEGIELFAEDGEPVILEQPQTSHANQSNTGQGQSNAGSNASSQSQELASQTLDVTHDPLTASELDHSQIEAQLLDPMLNVTAAKAKIESTLQQTLPTQNVDAQDVIDQIMNQVKATNAGNGFTEMRIALRPENLGDLVLRVLTQNGIVTAQFEAENQRVKEALEANFNQLRDALEEQGIKFSELSVSVRQDGQDNLSQFEQARQNARHRMEQIIGEGEVEEDTPAVNLNQNGVIDLTV